MSILSYKPNIVKCSTYTRQLDTMARVFTVLERVSDYKAFRMFEAGAKDAELYVRAYKSGSWRDDFRVSITPNAARDGETTFDIASKDIPALHAAAVDWNAKLLAWRAEENSLALSVYKTEREVEECLSRELTIIQHANLRTLYAAYFRRLANELDAPHSVLP